MLLPDVGGSSPKKPRKPKRPRGTTTPSTATSSGFQSTVGHTTYYGKPQTYTPPAQRTTSPVTSSQPRTGGYSFGAGPSRVPFTPELVQTAANNEGVGELFEQLLEHRLKMIDTRRTQRGLAMNEQREDWYDEVGDTARNAYDDSADGFKDSEGKSPVDPLIDPRDYKFNSDRLEFEFRLPEGDPTQGFTTKQLITLAEAAAEDDDELSSLMKKIADNKLKRQTNKVIQQDFAKQDFLKFEDRMDTANDKYADRIESYADKYKAANPLQKAQARTEILNNLKSNKNGTTAVLNSMTQGNLGDFFELTFEALDRENISPSDRKLFEDTTEAAVEDDEGGVLDFLVDTAVNVGVDAVSSLRKALPIAGEAATQKLAPVTGATTEGGFSGTEMLWHLIDKMSRPVYAVSSGLDAYLSLDDDKGGQGQGWMDPIGMLTGQSSFSSLDDLDGKGIKKILGAAKDGFTGNGAGLDIANDPTLGYDVIKNAAERNPETTIHDNKYVQHGFGFVLDVALAPDSYIGLGLIKPVTKAVKLGTAYKGELAERSVKGLAKDIEKMGLEHDPLLQGKNIDEVESLFDFGRPVTYDEIYKSLGGGHGRNYFETAVEKARNTNEVIKNANYYDTLIKRKTITPDTSKSKAITALAQTYQARRAKVLSELSNDVVVDGLRREIGIAVAKGDRPASDLDDFDRFLTTQQVIPAIEDAITHSRFLDEVAFETGAVRNSKGEIVSSRYAKTAPKAEKYGDYDAMMKNYKDRLEHGEDVTDLESAMESAFAKVSERRGGKEGKSLWASLPADFRADPRLGYRKPDGEWVSGEEVVDGMFRRVLKEQNNDPVLREINEILDHTKREKAEFLRRLDAAEKKGTAKPGSTWHQTVDNYDRVIARQTARKSAHLADSFLRLVEGRLAQRPGEFMYKDVARADQLKALKAEADKRLAESENVAYTGVEANADEWADVKADVDKRTADANGTPVESRPEDNWSQLDLDDPDLFEPNGNYFDRNMHYEAIKKKADAELKNLQGYNATDPDLENLAETVPAWFRNEGGDVDFNAIHEKLQLNPKTGTIVTTKVGDAEADTWLTKYRYALEDRYQIHYRNLLKGEKNRIDENLRARFTNEQVKSGDQELASMVVKRDGSFMDNEFEKGNSLAPMIMVDGHPVGIGTGDMFNLVQPTAKDTELSQRLISAVSALETGDRGGLSALRGYLREYGWALPDDDALAARDILETLRNNSTRLASDIGSELHFNPKYVAAVRQFRDQHGVTLADAKNMIARYNDKVADVSDKFRKTRWAKKHPEGVTYTEFKDAAISNRDSFGDLFDQGPFDFKLVGKTYKQARESNYNMEKWIDENYAALMNRSVHERNEILKKSFNSNRNYRKADKATSNEENFKRWKLNVNAKEKFVQDSARAKIAQRSYEMARTGLEDDIAKGKLLRQNYDTKVNLQRPLGVWSSEKELVDALAQRRGADYAREKHALLEQKADRSKSKQEIAEIDKALKDLRKQFGERKKQEQAFVEKAVQAKKAMSQRLQEDLILRMADVAVAEKGKALTLTTWGDRQLFVVPGSEQMFSAMEKLGGVRIIKASRQKWADRFKSPMSTLPEELRLERARAMSKLPVILEHNLSELSKRFEGVNLDARTNAFSRWRAGDVGDSDPTIKAVEDAFNDILPMFQHKYTGGDGHLPLEIKEIARYLPQELKLKKYAFAPGWAPKTGRDVVKAMLLEKQSPSGKVIKYVVDPLDLLWNTRIAVEKAVSYRALRNNIRDLYAVKRVPENQDIVNKLQTLEKPWEEIPELSRSKDDAYLFPPEIVPDVKRLLEMMQPQNIGEVGKLIDQATGYWKMATTIYNPGYYTRNGVGEVMSAWLGGVNDPHWYKQSMKLVQWARRDNKDIEEIASRFPFLKTKKNSELGKETALTWRDRKVTMEEIWAAAHDTGIKTNFINTEFNRHYSGLEARLNSSKTGAAAVKGHNTLRSAGEWQEDFYRMAHFMHAVKNSKAKTLDAAFADAAEQVRKYHFDYTDFTQFEKTVMLRAFPFYKWTRKAAPLMVSMLFQKPGKMLAYPKAMNAAQMMEDDQNGYLPNYGDQTPEFMKDLFTYMRGEDEEGDTTYAGVNTPQMDALRSVFDPVGTGAGLLNPGLKLPIELLQGETMTSAGLAPQEIGFGEGDKSLTELVADKVPGTNFLYDAVNRPERMWDGNNPSENLVKFITGMGLYEDYQTGSGGVQPGSQPVAKGAKKEGDSDRGAAPVGNQSTPNTRSNKLIELLKQNENVGGGTSRFDPKATEPRQPKKKAKPKQPFYQGIEDPVLPRPGWTPQSNGPLGDYGPRSIGQGFHEGVDMEGNTGDPIYAAANGYVTAAGEDGSYGNRIILAHGDNEATMYGHMSGFNVKPGQKVKKGDIIGYVGNTGFSTGPHLHFETWKNGEPVSPYTFLGGS